MFFDHEIDVSWCMWGTWRCTPAEAIGLWAVGAFYLTLLTVTVVHLLMQYSNGSAEVNETATRGHRMAQGNALDDWKVMVGLLVNFFTLVIGFLLWAVGGTRWVHPVQFWPIQLLGSAILFVCMVLFVLVHVQMGESWSPQPEQKVNHELVISGLFRWARHPMYAIFLWSSIGTLLATLNWVVFWCIFGLVPFTLRRIVTEERILVGLFGHRYLEYRSRVPALGAPWGFLGFDKEYTDSESNYLLSH